MLTSTRLTHLNSHHLSAIPVQGFWDASLILVQKSAGEVELSFGERLTLWAGPLEPAVWGMSVLAAFVVGMAYWFLENSVDGSDLDRDASSHNGIASFFGSLLLFTGGGGPAPRTFSGHFLLVGWSLYVLVVINGYAANLVAFLVKSQPPAFPMVDIADGNKRQLPVCVWDSAAPGPILKAMYPNMKKVSGTNGNLITKLNAGECDAAVMVSDSFRIQQRLKSYNLNCDKYKTGDVIYPASAGWAVNSDSGVKCTGIIRDTIDIYMVEMELEGFISDAKARWLDLPTTTNHTCAAGGDGGEVSETTPLGLDRFEGIFIILALIVGVSMVWGLSSKVLEKRAGPAAFEESVDKIQGENGEPGSKTASGSSEEPSVVDLLNSLREEMRQEMAEMKATLGALQPLPGIPSANLPLPKKGKSKVVSGDSPSPASEPITSSAEPKPQVAEKKEENGLLHTLTFGNFSDDLVFKLG